MWAQIAFSSISLGFEGLKTKTFWMFQIVSTNVITRMQVKKKWEKERKGRIFTVTKTEANKRVFCKLLFKSIIVLITHNHNKIQFCSHVSLLYFLLIERSQPKKHFFSTMFLLCPAEKCWLLAIMATGFQTVLHVFFFPLEHVRLDRHDTFLIRSDNSN